MGIYTSKTSSGLTLCIGMVNFHIECDEDDRAYVMDTLSIGFDFNSIYKRFKDYEITSCFIEE